jgi:hypothetical protein
MGRKTGGKPMAMWRWDQYLKKWVKFTGGVSEEGISQVQITDGLDDADVEPISDTTDNLDEKKGLVVASAGYGRISSSVVRPLQLDDSTHAQTTIAYEHHEVHGGSSFTVADTVACNATTVKWLITTPDTTKYAHLIFTLTSTGEATFLVTEGADRTDGTALTPINRRRVGTPTAATVTVKRGATGGTTDGATTLFTMRNGITNVAGKNIEGSTARATNEWILKPNTKYVVSITTYADVYATMVLDWYEHQDKD